MKLKKIIVSALAAAMLFTAAPAVAPLATVNAAATNATASSATAEVDVAKPTKVKLTAKSKAIKVTFKKVTGAKGYQIQYSTSKNFTAKTTKTVKTTKTSKTIKSLKAKKKYYVRVRSYTKSAGKTAYSNWTTTKKVKTKK